MADSRRDPPRRNDFAGELHTGAFSTALLDDVDVVCVSPGLALREKVIQEAAARGLPVLGDIELFAWHARQPVLGVTGTNGKSTVTALAGHLLRSAGVDCEVAGNIGPPVLQAFEKRLHSGKLPRAWVLELSSYQLETTWSLAPAAAAMLNLTEDHFDRYASLDDYGAAKARIFFGAGDAGPEPRRSAFGGDGAAGQGRADLRPRRAAHAAGLRRGCKPAGPGQYRNPGRGRAPDPRHAQRRQRACGLLLWQV